MSPEQRGLHGSLSRSLTDSLAAPRVPAGLWRGADAARTCPCCAVPVTYGAGSPLVRLALPQLRSALAKVERVYACNLFDGAVAPRCVRHPVARGSAPRALLALRNAGRTGPLPLLERVGAGVYELLRVHRGFSRVRFFSPVEVLLVPAIVPGRVCAAAAMRRRIFWCRRRRRQLNKRLPAFGAGARCGRYRVLFSQPAWGAAPII